MVRTYNTSNVWNRALALMIHVPDSHAEVIVLFGFMSVVFYNMLS